MKFDGIDTQGYIFNQRDLRTTNTPSDGRLIHDDQRMFFGDGVRWVEIVTDKWSPIITLAGDCTGSAPLSGIADMTINTTVNKYLEIPAGTIMLFGQASSPTGWTKITTWQDTAMICINSDANGTTLASGGIYSPQTPHDHTTSGSSNTGSGGAHTHGTSDGTVHSYTGSSGDYTIKSFVVSVASVGGHTHSVSVGGDTSDGPIPFYHEVIVAQRD
jgi:hypothetical protein